MGMCERLRGLLLLMHCLLLIFDSIESDEGGKGTEHKWSVVDKGGSLFSRHQKISSYIYSFFGLFFYYNCYHVFFLFYNIL